MKNRKIILAIILGIIITFVMFSFYQNDFKITKNEGQAQNEKVSIYVGDGETYEQQSSVPIGNYVLNEEKTYCVAGGKVKNYDKTKGTITYVLPSTDSCVVYFDTVPSGVTIVVSTDGFKGTLPTENGYKPELSCTNSNSVYSDKWQRVEIGSMDNGYTICNLNYKKASGYENLKSKVESINTTYNDGYRYVGKDPDNWIWFNNEMWRIIGSIPVCTSKTDPTTSGACAEADANRPRLVKIIRADSIGGLGFHSASGSNVWGNGNTLYTLLNSYYWGKGKVIGQSPCLGDFGALATCNYNAVGISQDDYYGKMVEEVFMNAGALTGASAVINASYPPEIGTVTKASHIGLMNASDYGYATSEITYTSISLSDLNSYGQNNWLFGNNGNEWTMTPSGGNVGVINSTGNFSSYGSGKSAAVRPVLYLNSSVYIIAGNGTALNPYVIGM